MKRIFSYAIFFIVACMPLTSYSFKIDTHLWVGQQIINDLEDDGKLSIKLDGKIVNLDIRYEVKDAILANKSAYLMGNLGPDSSPDVVVGQTVIHPGVKDADGVNIGWQTNKWLEHLLEASKNSEIGTAYAYGYLGHAAADVFLHTYVNQYAGDIFNLVDESLVEQRHFLLESFIGKYTPPLTDYRGNSIGSPWNVVAMDTELAEFIRDALIYDNEVQDEYWKVPTANHLAAYYEYSKGIGALAENGIWHEIDVVVAMIVAAYFDVQLSPDEAEQVVGAAKKVLDELNDSSEDVQQYTKKMYENARKFDDRVFGKVVSAQARMEKAEQSWMAKQQEWRRKLLDVKNLPSCELRIWYCKPDPKWYNPGKMDCGWRDDPVCGAAIDAMQVSNDLVLDVAERLEKETSGLNDDLVQATINLRNETTNAIDSVEDIHNGLTDFLQLISSEVSPIQSVLIGWQRDVDIAMTEYVIAANKAMINTMDVSHSSIDPLKEWFECYGGSIAGIPSSISRCGGISDSVGDVISSLENVIMILDEAAVMGADIPSSADLVQLKNELVDDLVEQLKDKVGDELADIIPAEIQDILVLLDADVDEAMLDEYFSKPETIRPAKGLLMIPDISARVKAEMNITSSRGFFSEKYAVAYNATVLAKMALLDKYGYEQLALLAGSNDFQDYYFDNLVAQAFGNIDGNHQWMSLPPLIPNSFSNYSPVDYTYSSDRSELGEGEGLGFVPWKGDMRDKIFRKVFIGPISPGIDAPGIINKTNLVGPGYPYQPCLAHPFPNDIGDRTCVAIMLIPILSILLH